MSGRMRMQRWLLGICFVVVLAVPAVSLAGPASAGDSPKTDAVKTDEDHGAKESDLPGLVAISAALAIGLSALATGFAQAKIGSAGVGALAENPKQLGAVIMLVAIPETVAILGFVVAYLIISS